MKNLLIGILLLGIYGCGVSQFTANTTASYKTGDGREVYYSSNKDQQGFEADADVDPATGRITKIHIKVDKSGTPEAAIAAAAQAQAQTAAALGKMVETVLPIIQGAIKGGAIGGGPGAAAGAVAGALSQKPAPKLDVPPLNIQPIP